MHENKILFVQENVGIMPGTLQAQYINVLMYPILLSLAYCFEFLSYLGKNLCTISNICLLYLSITSRKISLLLCSFTQPFSPY
jgi:hypothetical protein